jgi:hypothetical protein
LLTSFPIRGARHCFPVAGITFRHIKINFHAFDLRVTGKLTEVFDNSKVRWQISKSLVSKSDRTRPPGTASNQGRDVHLQVA